MPKPSEPIDLAHSPIIYASTAAEIAATGAHALAIERRGALLGWIAEASPRLLPTLEDCKARWRAADSVFLPALLGDDLPRFNAAFAQSHALYEAVLEGEEIEQLLCNTPYFERFQHGFEILSSSFDAADGQQIVRVDFDAVREQQVVAEELWLKASWLSYDDEDGSLRFRFSFGMDGYEDVGADFNRECYAATLAEHIFPESALITRNASLTAYLQHITGVQQLAYIERIVYFNAPNGGAQFHQDVEGVHLGIVFAQLTGRTAWLSLPKAELVREIGLFLQHPQAETAMRNAKIKPAWRRALTEIANDASKIANELDAPSHSGLELLINRVPAFFAQLVNHGYAYVLNPGDVLLLPQHNMQHCNWHSVFCLDEEAGEALSFAIRAVPADAIPPS